MRRELEPMLERFLESQERYELLAAETRRGAGPRLVDLGYANIQQGPPPAVLEILRESLATPRTLDLQYTPYGGATIARRVVADGLRRSHALPFSWRHVVLTPGAMAALNVVFRALRDEEAGAGVASEVIVPVPCWLDYPLYLVNLGLRPVMVPLAGGTLRLDVERIAAAITPRTRAIVLSQPANPTGLLYSAAELSALAEALTERSGGQALLISDECHRDRLAVGRTFVSPATYYANTCIVYSFGKALGMQGQRIGYAAVSPRVDSSDAFARRLERLCRVTGHATPTALMQLALRRLAAVPIDNSALDAARELVTDGLARAGYEFPAPDGTYFIYPRSPVEDSFLFAGMLARHDVLAMPAAVFHHEGHFRLGLMAPPDALERAVRALATVRDEVAAPGPRGASRSRALQSPSVIAQGPRDAAQAPVLDTRFSVADLLWHGGSFHTQPRLDPEQLSGETLAAARGRFALAVAQDEDRVLLVRDHLGLNKLFFALHEEGRVLAANHAIDLVRRGVPIEAIYSVPAGHLASIAVRRRDLQIERYAADVPPRPTALDVAAAAIRRELELWLSRLARAFPRRRVCVCLSGGVDSSVIAALAQRHFADLTAYTYTYAGDAGDEGTSDDADHAAEVAAALGIPLRLVPASADDVLAAVDDALLHGQDWRDFNVHCAIVNEILAEAIRTDAAPARRQAAGTSERDATVDVDAAPLVLTGDLMNEFMADYTPVSFGGRDYYRGPKIPAGEHRAALVRGLDAGDREVGVFSRHGALVVQPYALMFERYLELPHDLLDRPTAKQDLFRRVAGDLVPPSVFARRKVRAQIGNADQAVGVLPLLAEHGYDARWLRRRFCELYAIGDESFLSRWIRLGRYRFPTHFPQEDIIDGYYTGTSRRADRGLRTSRVLDRAG